MIALDAPGPRRAQAALRPHGDRGAARRGDDRRHLRPDGPDPQRLHRPAATRSTAASTSRWRPKAAFTSQFSAGPSARRRACVATVRAVPGCARRSRATSGRPERSSSTASSRSRAAAAARSSRPLRPSPSSPASNVDGRMPERSGEVALLTRHGRQVRPRARATGSASLRAAASAASPSSAHTTSAAPIAGGTDVVSAPLADIQRWFDREGEVTAINVAAERRRVARASWSQRIRPRRAGSTSRSAPARQAADENAADINDQIGGFLTPALLALRRRRAARRRVHHLQHLHDHRRRAHPRVRDAADARRHAAADPRRRGPRGARASASTASAARPGPRARCSPRGSAQLFEAVGLGIPTGGLELAPRTIARRAARRRRRDAARRAVVPARRATRVAADRRPAAWRPGRADEPSPLGAVARRARRRCSAWRCSWPACSPAARPPAGCRPWPAASCSCSSAWR